jgi:hypothetical protein
MRFETNDPDRGREYWIGALAMGVGVGVGALVMYFLDPSRGSLRRQRVRNRAEDAIREVKHEVDERASEAWNRAKLAVEEIRG